MAGRSASALKYTTTYGRAPTSSITWCATAPHYVLLAHSQKQEKDLAASISASAVHHNIQPRAYLLHPLVQDSPTSVVCLHMSKGKRRFNSRVPNT